MFLVKMLLWIIKSNWKFNKKVIIWSLPIKWLFLSKLIKCFLLSASQISLQFIIFCFVSIFLSSQSSGDRVTNSYYNRQSDFSPLIISFNQIPDRCSIAHLLVKMTITYTSFAIKVVLCLVAKHAMPLSLWEWMSRLMMLIILTSAHPVNLACVYGNVPKQACRKFAKKKKML